jgi:hypothetical protein
MHSLTRTPVTCIWATLAIALALGTLAFVGPEAVNTMFSLPVIGQYVAFAVPVAARSMGGRTWAPGPMSFGRLVSVLSSLPLPSSLFFSFVYGLHYSYS